MALKGTIKDFGVADIFQLISTQGKTGVLVFSNGADEVRVYFREGAVVRSDSTSRPAQMLLGNFLMRAGLISQLQLDHALREQKRNLKRIGTVLVELGHARPEQVTEMATLQMTETIYGLFDWKFGTYEFDATQVEASPEGIKPIRAETIVMNGIRMTDEWPGIRERLPSYGWLVERMRPLPPKADRPFDEFDLSALDEHGGGADDHDEIGSYERQIFGLIGGGRTVQQLIDQSRLGEFEACRALSTLVGNGYIRVIKPPEDSVNIAPPMDKQAKLKHAAFVGVRIGLSAVLIVGAATLALELPRWLAAHKGHGEARLASRVVADRLGATQMQVILRALEVHRYQTGVYPEKLDVLVKVGLLTERDLRFPYQEPYYYALESGAVVLLPPLF